MKITFRRLSSVPSMLLVGETWVAGFGLHHTLASIADGRGNRAYTIVGFRRAYGGISLAVYPFIATYKTRGAA